MAISGPRSSDNLGSLIGVRVGPVPAACSTRVHGEHSVPETTFAGIGRQAVDHLGRIPHPRAWVALSMINHDPRWRRSCPRRQRVNQLHGWHRIGFGGQRSWGRYEDAP